MKKETTRYEEALRISQSYGMEGEDAKRVANHIFARMITGGATIGKVNGKLVVDKKRVRPILPR